MNYAVPLFLFVALLGVALALTPTHAMAGRLLRVSTDVQAAVVAAARRKRVSPAVPVLLSVLGVGAGLALGGLLAWKVGGQGWVLGVGLAVAGALLPRSRFTANGWNVKFVRDVNADTLILLQVVYVISAVGRRPVEEAMRMFAQAWARRSQLADLLLSCPPLTDPVQFLADVDVPGQAYATLVLALRQAQEVGESQRKRVLGQHVQVAVTELKHYLAMLAKKRAQTAIVVGVLILLPTLMLAVLAPPMANLAGFFLGR